MRSFHFLGDSLGECMLNCFMLIWRCLIYNELSDAVAEFMAGDKCDSVNVHQLYSQEDYFKALK